MCLCMYESPLALHACVIKETHGEKGTTRVTNPPSCPQLHMHTSWNEYNLRLRGSTFIFAPLCSLLHHLCAFVSSAPLGDTWRGVEKTQMEPRGGDLVCRSFPDSFNLFNCFVLDAAFQCAAYILSIMLFFSFPLPLKSRLCPKPLVFLSCLKRHTQWQSLCLTSSCKSSFRYHGRV